MNNLQREQRIAAEKAFIDALNQLQETFETADEQKTQSPVQAEGKLPRKAVKPETRGFDLRELEEAAADIEQFMESQKRESSEE